jgi:plastocyanin
MPATHPAPRPQTHPGATQPAPLNGFGMAPSGMMGYPGMAPMQSYSPRMTGYTSGMAGSGGGMPASYERQDDTRAPAQTPSETMSLSEVLTASGVPTSGGQLRWPGALRAVAGADELRQQIDALLEEAAAQNQTGPANPHLAQELARSVAALRKALLRDREERFSLTLASYEDAERFLNKLDHARRLLAAGLEPTAGKAELSARAGNLNEVAVSDNRFEPATLTVPAGTTVRWSSHGGHNHTVTSDRGDWGSGSLAPGGAYSFTFTRPGEYPYHCEVHPEAMRGTIVVK